MTMQFQLEKQTVEILNVNIRKEAAGEEEGATLAADIKVCCKNMDANALQPLCPVDASATINIVNALFNDAGNPRFYGLGSVSFSYDVRDTEATLAGNHFVGVKAKNFTVTELHDGGTVDMTFSLQIHPTEAQVGHLAERIKEEVHLTIAPQPELPFESDAA
jgi:hypothetical protein